MSNRASQQELDAVHDLVTKIWKKDIENGQQAIIDLHAEYRQKYANATECHLWHKMVGSTIDHPTRPDFPGADSVIERLKGILDNL